VFLKKQNIEEQISFDRMINIALV